MIRKEIRTRRLIIRPLKVSDYDTWFAYYVNRMPSQSQCDEGPRAKKNCSKAIFRKMILRHKKLAKDDDCYWYGVFKKKSGQMIGVIDFDIFLRGTHQFANFGFTILNRCWGHGYGQEATSAGLRIGFKQLKLNRLEAAINLDNRKSIRLVKAIGMKREGIKKRYWFEYGEWVDHLIYVANPEDIGFKAVKPSD